MQSSTIKVNLLKLLIETSNDREYSKVNYQLYSLINNLFKLLINIFLYSSEPV